MSETEQEVGGKLEEVNQNTSLIKGLHEGQFVDAAGTAASAILSAFPDFKCLRCGEKKFHVRRSYGAVSVAVGQEDIHGQTRVEITCQHCGLIETHLASVLINTAWRLALGDNRDQGQ